MKNVLLLLFACCSINLLSQNTLSGSFSALGCQSVRLVGFNALEAHVWLIENSGRPLDSVYKEPNKSIDRMMPNLITYEKKFN